MKNRFAFGFYLTTIFGIFLYSFTQIDLSLTFSRVTLLRNVVTAFQYIGYFNRPLSTYIYAALLALLFGFYFYFLKLTVKKKLEKKTFWKIILVTAGFLVFSYNAFSYDLFNYIFDAKIFTHYHMNPYFHKALDFSGDPMLSFMRWTHRVYPYGPVWLIMTIPLSYLGLNFFIPTFFLFKILIASSYLGSLYFIGKILRKIKPDRETFGMVFFGLNPLVIIECLVSTHLDIVMIFFALFATYNLVNKKYLFAVVLLFVSIGVKFSSVFLLPVFFVVIFLQIKRKKINWDKVFVWSFILTCLTVIFASVYSGNFQPWYLILPFSYALFASHKYYIFIAVISTSIFALSTYMPYLYLGNYDPPVPQVFNIIYWTALIITIITILFYYFKHKSFASLSSV